MARQAGSRGEPEAGGRRKAVSSWADLQRDVQSIVEQINADPALAVAAAANALLALEELGYEIDPAARPEIEDRLRFRPDDAKRVTRLRSELFRTAGGPFDPSSDADVRRVLADVGVKVGRLPDTTRPRPTLQIRPPRPKSRAVVRQYAEPQPEPEWEDPLERLRDRHPIVAPLIEYRRLEAAEPRLATPDVYRAVRDGRRPVPIRRLRGVVKTDRER